MSDKKTRDIHLKNAARVKMDPAQCKRMCKAIGLEYREGYEERVIQFRMTDATRDRHNDIILPKGVDLSEYKKNPLVLFVHNAWRLPIGMSLNTFYDKEDDGVMGQLLFFDDETDRTGMSEDVFRMVNAGALKCGSIGFKANPQDIRSASAKEREQYGADDGTYIFAKIKLREFSIVPIPANPNAVQVPAKMAVRSKTIEALLEKGIDIMKDSEKYFVKSDDGDVGGEDAVKDDTQSQPTKNKEDEGSETTKSPVFTIDESEKVINVKVIIDDSDGFDVINKKIEIVKQLTANKTANTVEVEMVNAGQHKDISEEVAEIKQLLIDVLDKQEEKEEAPVTPDEGDDSDDSLYKVLENANDVIKQ